MRQTWWIAIGCFLLAGCGTGDIPLARGPDASPAARPASLQEARKLHFSGQQGNLAANVQALSILRRLLEETPQDPRILAYFGSARLLQARENPALPELHALSREGLTALDRAVELAPEDWEVRFLRGMACRHLPGFLGRAAQSAQDLALVADHASQGVRTGMLDARLAAAALYHHGLNLEAMGQPAMAREMWRQAATLGPDTPGGQAAASRLNP